MHLRCPICQAEKEVDDAFPSRPFCSPRCKALDLKNWLDGVYRLPRDLTPEELLDLPPDEQEQVIAALGAAGKLH
jgi:uncharacterized protein